MLRRNIQKGLRATRPRNVPVILEKGRTIMQPYLRLLFCGAKLIEVKNVVNFAEWVAAGLNTSQNISVAGRRIGDSLRVKPLIKGEYVKYKDVILESKLQSLDLVWGKWTESGVELFLHLEIRMPVSSDGADSTSERSLSESSLPSCFALMVLGIRSDLWMHCDEKFMASYFERADKLFVEFDCKYGYFDEASHPSLSCYSPVTAKEHSSEKRIIDFDYANYIEDIHPHNYLSLRHISALKPIEPASDLSTILDSLELRDERGITKGARISLKDRSARGFDLVREFLRPLGV